MAAVAPPSWVKPVWSGTNEEAEEMCKAFVMSQYMTHHVNGPIVNTDDFILDG